ncbi:hypothetical protein SI65_09093 [Aspergillus cristatus]|uniref:Uncharacterized protein n=1 Tax=Aspergillus cristatus TaxID=573508 RepID=A0A1E3B3F2_ASPCR|nr:hypothetical protein SI65_09093 [Aspergillus cristatus]
MSFSTQSSTVGTLARWDPRTGQTSHPSSIDSNEEVYVGRDSKRCQYVIDDPFISNKHLRIYTILFDRENPSEVAPLVYAQDLSMNGTTWNNYRMGEGSGSFLLSHGDKLKLTPDIHLIFLSEEYKEDKGFDMLQKVEMKVFQDQYVITPRKLGSGAYGRVHMAYIKDNGQQLACKVVDLRAMRDRATKEIEEQKLKFFRNKWQASMVKSNNDERTDVIAVRGLENYLSKKVQEKLDIYHREAKVLENLSHPNIISVEKVIRSSNTIYLFQDLITAGDLFSFIQYKGGKLGDIESAVVVRQVLMALDYLHDRDIVHRDLKPDNILMTSLADGGRVVLTDFGCARLVKPMIERMSTMIGTFEYSAPEVLQSNQKGYTKAVDLWSLGCVTAILLTGDSPFRDPGNLDNPAQPPQDGDFERLEQDMEWHHVGTRARDFVRQLLVLDETKRMSVKHALRHSWFTNRAHKREFEALYRRSIRDWKPRAHQGPLMVDLCSLIEIRKTRELHHANAVDACVERRGQLSHRPPSFSENPSQDSLSTESATALERPLSPTLSDPDLPTHNRTRNESFELGDLSYYYQKQQPDMEFSAQSIIPNLPTVSTTGKNRRNVPLPFTGDTHTIPIKKRVQDPWEVPEDEVYEEVSNAMTGKRQQVAYGSTVVARAAQWT